jgi:hypothetical protein
MALAITGFGFFFGPAGTFAKAINGIKYIHIIIAATLKNSLLQL